jgi:Tfp pilus assembly protein PilF
MRKPTHFGRLCAILVCGLALGGCATQGPVQSAPRSPTWLDDAAFADKRFEVDVAAVAALSPAMRAYLQSSIAPHRDVDPARALLDALYETGGLRIAYDGSTTRTAAETFAARRGDCLSLALMTAAFARELGMEVRFQRVLVRDVVIADGDLVRVIGHVNVSLGSRLPGALQLWTTIDFLPSEDARQLRFEPISMHRVEAMHFNNKAAEMLADGQIGKAYWWARASVTSDPSFPSAYITLGAIWDRADRRQLARLAYGRALELDPGNPNVTKNLALMDSRDLRLTVSAATTGLERTMLSQLKAGEFENVRQRALQALQSGGVAELHLILAAAYSGLGEAAKAAEELLAYRDSGVADHPQQTALDAKIAALRAMSPSAH